MIETIIQNETKVVCVKCGCDRFYSWLVVEKDKAYQLAECAACVDRNCAELHEELQLENDSIGGC